MSEADNTRHAFDRAISLTPSAPNRFTGHTTDAYSNMVGPFGGITAAALLNAVLQHPERIGEPVALTVNFAGPIAAGEFVIEALPVRTNRSTQHWTLQLLQNDMVATTATVFCAMRRETWSEQELPAPEAPAPETLPPLPDIGLHGWTANYDFRFVSGMFNPSRPLARLLPAHAACCGSANNRNGRWTSLPWRRWVTASSHVCLPAANALFRPAPYP